MEIILVLGHSGVIKDQEIAAACPDIDVVVGGHCELICSNLSKNLIKISKKYAWPLNLIWK